MNLLTFPVPLLHRAMRALHQHTEDAVRWPVGMSRWGRHVELLAALPGSALGQVLRLAWSDTLALPRELPPDCAGVLLLGRRSQRGRARGLVHLPGYATDDLVTMPTSITRLPALHATQASDVLVTCVDHDSARLAASALATLFSKPLLDLATGVHGHGSARQMGADVRLVLPGHCLLCFGGLRDVVTARQVLASAEAEQTFYAQRDWQQERAGSLASLNQCAVGVVLRLWEDFLAARIHASTWAHLEFAPTGHLTVTYPTVSVADNRCLLCRLSGWGEEGVPHLRDLLRQDHVWHQGTERRTHGTTERA